MSSNSYFVTVTEAELIISVTALHTNLFSITSLPLLRHINIVWATSLPLLRQSILSQTLSYIDTVTALPLLSVQQPWERKPHVVATHAEAAATGEVATGAVKKGGAAATEPAATRGAAKAAEAKLSSAGAVAAGVSE